MSPLALLVWISTSGEPLDADKERAAITDIARRYQLDLAVAVDEPVEALPAWLANHPADVFHFIGHGTPAGDLLMSDEGGHEHPVAAPDLARLLRSSADGGPTGVVLNACHSGAASHALAPKGGWVLAMDGTVRDDTASAYAATFYQCLAAGQAPHEAAGTAEAHLAVLNFAQADLSSRIVAGPGYGFWASPDSAPITSDRQALMQVMNAFRRPAFSSAAIEELSYAELMEALEHTSLMFATGDFITRHRPDEPYSKMPDHARWSPALLDLRTDVIPLLNTARIRVQAVQGLLPGGGDGMYVMALRSLVDDGNYDEARKLLAAMNLLDEARSEILRTVNAVWEAHDGQPLPLIRPSSDVAVDWHINIKPQEAG